MIQKPPASRIAGVLVLAIFSSALILFHTASAGEPTVPNPIPAAAEEVSLPHDTADSLDSADSTDSADSAGTAVPEPEPISLSRLAQRFDDLSGDPAFPLGTMTEDALSLLDDDTLRALDALLSGSPNDMATTAMEPTAVAMTAAELGKAFYDLTGFTPLAYLYALDTGSVPETAPSGSERIGNLVFTGDFNLGEDFSWCPIHRLSDDASVSDILLPPLDTLLSSADFTCVNLECAVSERGTPTQNKLYTFRAKPDSLRYLTEAGCDLVSLANNHVYDYGADALTDTIRHLDDAGILHIGAGEDLASASEPVFVNIGGIKVGFAAASNAEKYRLTPHAGEDSPGILTMYDPDEFYAVLESAAAQCDYLVAVVHWGTENSTEVNDNQRELTEQFIRLGADAVIGHHPHVLQPTEIIDGVPVCYSLGNFWFNTSYNETAAAELVLAWDGGHITTDLIMHPCIHDGGITYLTSPDPDTTE